MIFLKVSKHDTPDIPRVGLDMTGGDKSQILRSAKANGCALSPPMIMERHLSYDRIEALRKDFQRQ